MEFSFSFLYANLKIHVEEVTFDSNGTRDSLCVRETGLDC
jgi:hypothetical protein